MVAEKSMLFSNFVLCFVPIISFLLDGNACVGVFLERFLALVDYLRAYGVSSGSIYTIQTCLSISKRWRGGGYLCAGKSFAEPCRY